MIPVCEDEIISFNEEKLNYCVVLLFESGKREYKTGRWRRSFIILLMSFCGDVANR